MVKKGLFPKFKIHQVLEELFFCFEEAKKRINR